MKNREWFKNTSTIDKLMTIAKNYRCPVSVFTRKENAMLVHKQCKVRRANGSCLKCLCDWLNEEAKQ